MESHSHCNVSLAKISFRSTKNILQKTNHDASDLNLSVLNVIVNPAPSVASVIWKQHAKKIVSVTPLILSEKNRLKVEREYITETTESELSKMWHVAQKLEAQLDYRELLARRSGSSQQIKTASVVNITIIQTLRKAARKNAAA